MRWKGQFQNGTGTCTVIYVEVKTENDGRERGKCRVTTKRLREVGGTYILVPGTRLERGLET